MIHLRSIVPFSSAGGWLGSVQSLIVNVHCPTNGSSFLCSAPGLPASASAFRSASGLGGVFGSSACVTRTRTPQSSASAAAAHADLKSLFISISYPAQYKREYRRGGPVASGAAGPRRRALVSSHRSLRPGPRRGFALREFAKPPQTVLPACGHAVAM